MRIAAKRDSNEAEIIDALTADGNICQPVSDDGIPDLLVWCWRDKRFRVLEVKDGSKVPSARNLTTKQVRFFQRFGDAVAAGDVVKVESVEQALAAVGAIAGKQSTG